MAQYLTPPTKKRRVVEDEEATKRQTSAEQVIRKIPLDELPTDLISHMLYYIPIKATTKISMSSKKWTHIFSYKHALAVPTNTMFGSVLTIQRVISQPFSRVSTVVIRSTDMDILSSELISALRWLPSLRTLRLVDRAASEEFLAPVVQECPVALADIGLRLSHLELGFSNCKYTTLELLLDLFPNLTDLAVPKGEFSVAHVDLMSQQPKIPIEICLFWAIYYRHENKAVQLIESKSDINYDFVYRETTIFHQAVRFMTVATVSQMIALGASINQVNGKGKTGLHLAAEHRLTAMARLLIEHGANVNAEVPRGAYRMAGRTPLHIACLSDKRARDIIADLVKAGALIDPRDVDGTTPLMVAATVLGLDEPADWFITDFVKAGADVNGINNEGKTPLMFASENGNLNMIKLLVKHGAKVNQRCVPSLIHSNPHAEMRSGATALHFAVDRDMKAVLKLLIELGADANIVSDIGWTPLHEACWRGSPDAVELLLSHMKKFPRPDGTSLVEWVPSAGRRVARDSRNPLFIAAQFSDIKIVEALLARKDFSRYISQKCYGLTPLEVATLVESRSNSRNPTAVRELLQKYTNEKVGTHDVLYAKVLDATRPAACTFTLTGRHFAAQHYWTCSDCHSEPSRGAHDRGKYICATCIEQCHSGHNIVYGGILLTFCRCGSSPLRNCKASPHYEH